MLLPAADTLVVVMEDCFNPEQFHNGYYKGIFIESRPRCGGCKIAEIRPVYYELPFDLPDKREIT